MSVCWSVCLSVCLSVVCHLSLLFRMCLMQRTVLYVTCSMSWLEYARWERGMARKYSSFTPPLPLPSPPPTQAHNDLIKTYEAKLSSFGIPSEELGFKPLQSTMVGQTLGQGPAGLVASPTSWWHHNDIIMVSSPQPEHAPCIIVMHNYFKYVRGNNELLLLWVSSLW